MVAAAPLLTQPLTRHAARASERVTVDRFIPSITVGPVTRRPPTNVSFGERYGRPYKDGARILWMFRRGQRVRFFTAAGVHVGEEQRNVAPAVCYALSQGWVQL